MTDTMNVDESATETEAAPKKKRVSIAEKTYMIGGESKRHASPGVEQLVFTFANGVKFEVNRGDLPAEIFETSGWHGLAQKLGDAYAGAKGDVDTAVEMFESVLDQLKSGEWVQVGEGPGTSPRLVADAVKIALEAHGESVDTERYAAILEKVKGKENRERTLRNPDIKAAYEKLKADRAATRARKAAEAAAAAGGPVEGAAGIEEF